MKTPTIETEGCRERCLSFDGGAPSHSQSSSSPEEMKDIVQSHTKLKVEVRDAVLEVVGYMGKVNEGGLEMEQKHRSDKEQEHEDADSPR
jgi:hypothetical protein